MNAHRGRRAPQQESDALLLPAACLLGLLLAASLLLLMVAEAETLIWSREPAHAGLGEAPRILAALGRNPGEPWRAWPPRDAALVPHSLLLFSGIAVVLLIALCLPVCLLIAGRNAPSASRRRAARGRARRGSSHPRARVALGRSRVGRVVRAAHDANILVVAPPGAAKTTGVVIPALLEWPGSVVVLSTKPDVLDATRAARARRGRVLVFDPLGKDGDAAWNPLHGCTTWSVALDRAAALTGAARSGNESHDARWWDALASDTIAPLLHAGALADLPMRAVHTWCVRNDAETPRRILAGSGSSQQALAGLNAAIDDLDSTRAREERARSSTWTSAGQLLRVYRRPELDREVAQRVDPEAFAREEITLYVIASEERQEILQPLIIALVDAVYQASLRAARACALDPPLLLALDECANIAPLRRLPGYLTQCRTFGIHFITAWQALSQIEYRYGARMGEILQSSSAQVYAGSHSERATLEHLQRQLAPLDPDDPDAKRQRIDPRRLRGHFLVLGDDAAPRLLSPRLSFSDRRLRRLAGKEAP